MSPSVPIGLTRMKCMISRDQLVVSKSYSRWYVNVRLLIHYIYIYTIPPQGGRFSIQNFWKKSLKVQIVPKNRFKNSAEKLENMNSLDFTYYHLIFILYQHLIIYVRNDFTPECIKYYRSSFLLAAYNGEKLGDFILCQIIKNNIYTIHHTY